MAQKASMVSIGRAAGVSHATVSKVINDRWREKGITQETRDRVWRIAQEMNYRPNRLVRSVFTGRTFSVAVILPSIRMSYFTRVAMGVAAEAKRHGYHTLLSNVEQGIEDEASEIESLLERRVDGLMTSLRFDEANRANYRRLTD
ncbi:MAG: LacI family DNA-binding transcriptional regulator [Kiritimatiellae bacterium]|nr:LacI family DNA-binding transcriptional regulator [Kiritimatiellia bacterium]